MNKQLASAMLSFGLLASGIGCKRIAVAPGGNWVPLHGLYEITIEAKRLTFSNPWEDVAVSARLTDTRGQTLEIDGFYYRDNLWKVRFSPPTTGLWRWTLSFAAAQKTWNASGSFHCEPSDRPGYVRRHPTNPFRLVFANGALFNAIGIGDCIMDVNRNGTPIQDWGFDGGLRHGLDPHSVGHDIGTVVDMSRYLTAYGVAGAGFNLFRWSIDNCAFKLWETIATGGNRYLVQEGLWGDELVAALQQHGFRIWLTFFNVPPFLKAEQNPAEQAAIKRYMRYVVARFGAYVDIWELMNEVLPTDVSPAWIALAADYLRSIDPYKRLISTSWERADLPSIDVHAPHWFERESELDSDLRTAQEIAQGKPWGKPVIFAEQANQFQNWDERSALRMRLRSWTAFFEEGIIIFWNSSFAKDYFSEGSANIYLGPEERSYIRVLQNYTSNVDAEIQRFPLTPSNDGIRAYGLRSPRMILGYFHHFRDHEKAVRTNVVVDLPANGTVTWVRPADGTVLESFSLPPGQHTLTTPDFVVDLALKIQ